MFNNDIFDMYLEHESKKVLEKLEAGKEPLSHDDKMIMMLKSQTNHFYHLDKELRQEIQQSREDSNKQMNAFREEMKALREDLNALREDTNKQINTLREDTNKQINTLREDTNKRFEIITQRIDRFMFWSLTMTLSSTIFLFGMLKFWN